MFLKSVFGVIATVLILVMGHTVSRNYTFLRTRKFSFKYILRTLSSIGVILPIECFLLYVFVSYNGAASASVSSFFTQSLVMPSDVMFSVFSQQAFIVNALKLISAITFGTVVVYSLSEGLEFALSHARVAHIHNDYEKDTTEFFVRDFSYTVQPAYLRFGGFLN